MGGVDPIVVASQIVLGLQTIVSRQVDITRAPVIVTVGRFQGGVRSNIVPDTVELEGTIGTFDEGVKKDVHARAKRTAEQIAAAAGATAGFVIEPGYPVTVNDPGLTEQMAPTLARVAGKDRVSIIPPTTTSEDFFLLPAACAGTVLLPRGDTAVAGLAHGRGKPLAPVRGRRGRAAGRHAGPGASHARLPHRALAAFKAPGPVTSHALADNRARHVTGGAVASRR